MHDGILQLQLRSHDGTIGTFWVHLQSRAVVKTEFRNASSAARAR
jgi:hypothetical protein